MIYFNTEITAEEIRENLYYNKNTGNFTHINRNKGGRAVNGKIAGSLGNGKYRVLSIKGKKILAHRAAFLYITGEYPNMFIDHINRNRSDNRWSNLREADKSINSRNTDIYKNNSSGTKGVSFHKNSGKWRVTIWSNSKQISGGYFNKYEEAVRKRRFLEVELGYIK